jgi:hypothetical protein
MQQGEPTMSERPEENLSGLLRMLKQQDAVSLRSLLAAELNNHIQILKMSGQSRYLDQRDVGLILDRWTNVVTTMNLSVNSAEAYKPVGPLPQVIRPPSMKKSERAEQVGTEAVRREFSGD